MPSALFFSNYGIGLTRRGEIIINSIINGNHFREYDTRGKNFFCILLLLRYWIGLNLELLLNDKMKMMREEAQRRKK